MPPLAYAFWQSTLSGLGLLAIAAAAAAAFRSGADALKTYFLVGVLGLGLPGALLTFTAPSSAGGSGDAGPVVVAAAHLPVGRRRAPAAFSLVGLAGCGVRLCRHIGDRRARQRRHSGGRWGGLVCALSDRARVVCHGQCRGLDLSPAKRRRRWRSRPASCSGAAAGLLPLAIVYRADRRGGRRGRATPRIATLLAAVICAAFTLAVPRDHSHGRADLLRPVQLSRRSCRALPGDGSSSRNRCLVRSGWRWRLW